MRKNISRNLLNNILENISQGICVYDKNYKLTHWNQRFVELLQLPPDFLKPGLSIEEIIYFNAERGEYGEGNPYKIAEQKLAEINNHTEVQPHCYDRLRQDGSYIEVRGNRMPDGGLVTTYSDVTERKKSVEMIQKVARHDSLTGLINRHHFHEKLEESIQRGLYQMKSFALLLLDVDRFKMVNDTFGHPVGDKLLAVLGRRLCHQVREHDIVARLGGDEYAIILNEIDDISTVISITNRILQNVNRPVSIEGIRLNVDITIGISIFPLQAEDTKQLVQHADVALYNAKNTCLGSYRIYHTSMDEQAQSSLTIENEFQQALENNELVVYYQPQFTLDDQKKFTGIEASLQWDHPRLGLLPYEKFALSVAASGYTEKTSEWLFKKVYDDYLTWYDNGIRNIRISFNASYKQLQNERFIDYILSELIDKHHDPKQFELIISESIINKGNFEQTAALQKMKQQGMSLIIENFGANHTSLLSLQQLPVKRVKISSHYVNSMTESKENEAIIEAIVKLAHSFRQKTLASSISNSDQLSLLQRVGCDEGQGDYLCKPLKANDFADWYQSQQH